MARETATRKWQVTINNPLEKGYTHEVIKSRLGEFKSLVYACMSDEVGEEGTPHTHIYLQCKSAVMFSTVKKRFDGGHFEMAKGTAQENRDYVAKDGKWKKDKKHETCIEGTFEEVGECPVERPGLKNDLVDLYAMIQDGMSDSDILAMNPDYMVRLSTIAQVRSLLNKDKYADVFRDLHVTYIYGATGLGKTRYVMDKYGYSKVFRVTDYLHPFDTYDGQDVVLFDEFRSSLRLTDMLKYLDGYPLELPCRYANKWAAYTQVYIVSNISLSQQYQDVQRNENVSFLAFLRRVHQVYRFFPDGVEEQKIELYRNGWEAVPMSPVPFSSL